MGVASGRESGQKPVVLILARELAANIATPMLVLDRAGTLVFFNEPAEVVLGCSFADTGEIPVDEWDRRWKVFDGEGKPMSLLTSPLAVVATELRPAHGELCIQGLDGVQRCCEATVYPLFDSARMHQGAVGVFWEKKE
jgi:PAS domain-containing protein